MNIEDIAKVMSEPHGSVVHAIDALEQGKLLESRVLRDAPYQKEVTLTPLGRLVTQKIKEIEELIGWMGKEGVT